MIPTFFAGTAVCNQPVHFENGLALHCRVFLRFLLQVMTTPGGPGSAPPPPVKKAASARSISGNSAAGGAGSPAFDADPGRKLPFAHTWRLCEKLGQGQVCFTQLSLCSARSLTHSMHTSHCKINPCVFLVSLVLSPLSQFAEVYRAVEIKPRPGQEPRVVGEHTQLPVLRLLRRTSRAWRERRRRYAD